MEENKNWSEINNEISETTKKIKEKFEGDDLVDDLNDSLQNTIINTNNMLKNILNNLESNINDEEIKSESKKLIHLINSEFNAILHSTQTKLGNLIDFQKYEEE